MKTIYYLLIAILFVSIASSCGKLEYRKTKTGLLYKIIPSGGKDSLAKPGDWLKIYFIQKRNNDSVMQDNYGKMPIYQQVQDVIALNYNPAEIFPLLKKGDSAMVVIVVDSLLKGNASPQGLPPYLKKGDRINLSFKVVDVFRSEDAYQADNKAEYEKDLPRQQKEKKEQMAKMKKEMLERKVKELQEAEQSGEAAKQRKEVETYLASKNIKAQKTGKGTYVVIKELGNGAKADSGKYVTVKYSGKLMETDTVFQANTYPSLLLGVGDVIDGWDEGLQLFREGGKGILYIPGYLAYGKNPGPGSKPNEALIFDVEIIKVSDKPDPVATGPQQ